MAYYLVTATPNWELETELIDKLKTRAFEPLRPFGREIMKALTKARLLENGAAVWEEEDYCNPPLRAERAAVLDRYFTDITVQDMGDKGNGWKRIYKLPRLFPEVDIYVDPDE
jgi:hypothetical protein